MKLREFRDILVDFGDGRGMGVFHSVGDKSKKHIVWQETGEDPLSGDGVTIESGTRFAVDCYLKDEYSDIPGELESYLEGFDEICVSLDAIDYENDTGFYHYAFTCEVV